MPGDNISVAVGYIRPNVKVEKPYKLVLKARDKEAVLRPTGSAVRVLVQPLDGTAKVSWARDETEVLFTNKGNITSRFSSVEVCDEQCKPAADIVVPTNGTAALSASAAASVKLVQIVGDNSQEGVIPPVAESTTE